MGTELVKALAFGGQGIVKQEGQGGMVVFIPHVLPGDLISYRIAQRKKNYAIGELEALIAPSKDRIEPRCPYFGTCGGCQLQHMSYSAQLQAKRGWIEEALTRIGGVSKAQIPAIAPASEEWGYRRKITLTLFPENNRYRLGYCTAKGGLSAAISQCPIFTSPEDPALSRLQESVGQLIPPSKEYGKLSILKHDEGGHLLHFHFARFPSNLEEICEKLSQAFLGITAASSSKTISWGQVRSSLEIDGLTIHYSSSAFIQAHPDQSACIYRLIVDAAQELKPAMDPPMALDLYCGIGTLSLMLARRGWEVMGVEWNRHAVELAQENAQANGIERASFFQGDVGKWLPQLLKKHQPAMLILNPPREGLQPDTIKALMECRTNDLFYISCMPPTLARDLKALEKAYLVVKVDGFDMFPHTTHVETVVRLQRRVP